MPEGDIKNTTIYTMYQQVNRYVKALFPPYLPQIPINADQAKALGPANGGIKGGLILEAKALNADDADLADLRGLIHDW
jgi:hypothetical protein